MSSEDFRSRRARRAHLRVSTFSDTRFRRFKGDSKTASTATQTQTAINQQVGASEGAVAVGSGANVTFNQLDAEVAKSSVDAVSEVSKEALAVGGQTTEIALDFGGNVVDKALDTGSENLETIVGFASDFTKQQLEAAARATQDASNLARSSTETVASTLQRNAGDSAATVVQDTLKTAMYSLLGVAAVGGLVLVLRRK